MNDDKKCKRNVCTNFGFYVKKRVFDGVVLLLEEGDMSKKADYFCGRER